MAVNTPHMGPAGLNLPGVRIPQIHPPQPLLGQLGFKPGFFGGHPAGGGAGIPDFQGPGGGHGHGHPGPGPGPTPTQPTGPEAYGDYAAPIYKGQLGVDKSLKPGKAFLNSGVGGNGGGVTSFGSGGVGLGGMGGFGGGDMSSLMQMLAQYLLPGLMQQLQGQPIAGGK